MTQGRGDMRETYPVTGEVFHYRIDERDGRILFDLEDGAQEDLPSTIALTIESRVGGEGLCRTESGRTYAFAWAWVGPELHLWLDGALYVFQRPEPRRRGSAAVAEASGDILAPMPGAVLEVLVAEGDRVVYRSTNVGRHVGELAGVAGTGHEVSITSLAAFRFEEGRIAEVWVEMDILSLTR